MRFLILKPAFPLDPRALEVDSTADLHAKMPPIAEFATEKAAADEARRRYPDAVAMPVPMHIGAGQVFLLGFLKDASKQIDPDDDLPFVICIQAVSENDHERARAKRAPVFDKTLWRVKVARPEIYEEHAVEMRSSDAAVPVFTKARVGSYNGRLTIFVDLHATDGVQMSMTFADPRLTIVEMPEPQRPDHGGGMAGHDSD